MTEIVSDAVSFKKSERTKRVTDICEKSKDNTEKVKKSLTSGLKTVASVPGQTVRGIGYVTGLVTAIYQQGKNAGQKKVRK